MLQIIGSSLYILDDICYGSLTASRRKNISHEPRDAEVWLRNLSHILDLDALIDAFLTYSEGDGAHAAGHLA